MGRIKKVVEQARTGVKKAGKAIFKNFDLRDAFAFGGIALMAAGLWQIFPPVSFIIPGALFFWMGIRKVA